MEYGVIKLYKYFSHEKFICLLLNEKNDLDFKIYCDDNNSIEAIAERDFDLKIEELFNNNKNINPYGEKSFSTSEIDISNVTNVMNTEITSTLSGTDIF